MSALRDLLEGDGHDVDTFTNGHEAVSASAQRAFDVLLTDFEMPYVMGDVVVRAARLHQPTACIFMTTSRTASTVVEGACHVFDKPLDYELVSRTVADCLARRGQGRHRCYMKSDHG